MIETLEVENFCQFEHFKISLKKRGLLWVSGENKDTESADSNGSGKSNLFRAVGWTLWGKCVDGFDGDEMIRRGTKCATASITLDGGWKVIRERRKASPRLYLYHDGKEQPGGSKEIQVRINELVGVDFDTFRNTSLYGGTNDHRFIHTTTKDSDRKEILHGILRTAIYGAAHEWVKKKASEIRSQLLRLDNEIQSLDIRIEERDPGVLERSSERWEKDKEERVSCYREEAAADIEKAKKLRKFSPDTSKLEKDVGEIEATKAKIHRAETELEMAEERLEKNKEKLVESDKLAWSAKEGAKAIRKHLAELSGEKCSMCGSTLSKGEAAKHIEKLNGELSLAFIEQRGADAAYEALQLQFNTLANLRRVADDNLTSLRFKLARLEDSRVALAEARSVKSRVSDLARSARVAMRRAKVASAEVNPFASQVEDAKKAIAEYKARKSAKDSESKALAVDLAHYEFWVRGFGQTGLPSFVLDSTMPFLTDRTNKYLETLSDGDITMSFSTQRELKSSKGEYRDNISIQWEIEGIPNHAPSNGQFKKMEIATNFALMDLVATTEGASLDLLLLDECLDGLDAEGRNRVLQLLHKLRKARGTIMVISHDPGMGELFERCINVVKEGGVATLSEAA